MDQKTVQLNLDKDQCELIIKAIEAYLFATGDVMTYDEIQERRKYVVNPIYDQMPDELF